MIALRVLIEATLRIDDTEQASSMLLPSFVNSCSTRISRGISGGYPRNDRAFIVVEEVEEGQHNAASFFPIVSSAIRSSKQGDGETS